MHKEVKWASLTVILTQLKCTGQCPHLSEGAEVEDLNMESTDYPASYGLKAGDVRASHA